MYKHYNESISQKIVDLDTTNKKQLKFDVIDGSVVNGLGQPIVFGLVFKKKSNAYKVLCELETIHYKKRINLFWILKLFI